VQGFADLGLAIELVGVVERVGYEDPTPLQRAAIPVIRRGGNVLLRASSGAGLTAAYGLGVLDRLAPIGLREDKPRALVVVGSPERATEVAGTLARLGRPVGLRARALGPGWRRGPADIIVAPLDAALRGVQDSSVKLDALDALVIEGAAAVLAAHGIAALETLLVTVNQAAQRIVTTAEITKDVERLVQGHARRAMEIPPRPVEGTPAPTAGARGELQYVVVAHGEKETALAELLGRRSDAPHTVIARTASRAEALREALTLRGFAIAGEGEAADGAITVLGALDAPRATIAYDVPADGRVLERMQEQGVVLVTPRELPHLRALASEAGYTLKVLERRARRGEIAAFRERVRRAAAERDLDAQLLVLDPLFDEFSAAELAAALSAMVRERESVVESGAPPPETREPGRPAAFVRLFVSIGQRDGIRPADIVGAFTSEAGVSGDQVGRIEIRDTFSVVEVDASAADRVIRALNGTTMRGRSLRVDFDRKMPAAPKRSRATRSPP
jgi:ATP-dependent RNA helicase DeaD